MSEAHIAQNPPDLSGTYVGIRVDRIPGTKIYTATEPDGSQHPATQSTVEVYIAAQNQLNQQSSGK